MLSTQRSAHTTAMLCGIAFYEERETWHAASQACHRGAYSDLLLHTRNITNQVTAAGWRAFYFWTLRTFVSLGQSRRHR